MGHGDDAGALRVSIGHSTGDDDIAMFADALAEIVARRTDEGRLKRRTRPLAARMDAFLGRLMRPGR